MINTVLKICILFIFSFNTIGCSHKKPIVSKSTIIIFKTPIMKFYDKGFVTTYNDHIHLQIFNTGILALDLKIYSDKICQSTFKCIDSDKFNNQYLSNKYPTDFLYKLFIQDKIYYKDKINNIFIKVL